MERLCTNTLKMICLGILGLTTGCTLNANVSDISEVELSFATPAQNTFSNKTNYAFEAKLNSDNKNLTLDKAKLHVFEDGDCDADKLVQTRAMNGQNSSASTAGLENGKKYSARITITTPEKIFQSVCSSWVGIDTLEPSSVAVNYPNNNHYITKKEFMAAWSSSTDAGISGLREKPYLIRLYGQAACAGAVLQTGESHDQTYLFKNLTHGVIYSALVSSFDNAGNESIVTCSPYTEIDVYAPGFQLNDPSSIPGYSRTLNPTISFTNDSTSAYWCVTNDTTFRPLAFTEICPGGSGPASGWYTTRPTHLPLPSGDGLKVFNLWSFRGDGTPVSTNVTSAAILLDRTLPGSLSISGIISTNEDVILDQWLTSSEFPIVKWSESTDAVEYSLQILNSSLQIICEKTVISAPANTHEFTDEECDELTNAQTYKVLIRSFDVARNTVSAPDFYFTVDRTPPGTFTIGGVSGGSDIIEDGFIGTTLPTVHFSNASGATRYEIEIKDPSEITVCTLGSKASPTTYYNYAVESGVSCVLLDGGLYKAYVSAFDDGKNKTPASNNGYLFQVDQQTPSLAITSAPIILTPSTSASFTFTASDAISGLNETLCAMDTEAFSTCVSPKTFTGLAEGSHTFNVRGLDIAGNATTQSETWIVDLTNPVLTIHTAPLAVSNNSAADFTFSATDSSGIKNYTCSLNGSPFIPCTSPQNLTVAQGSHTFIVRATDHTDWFDEKSKTFLVDLTIPTINITSTPALITSSGTATFNFTSADSGGSGVSRTECSFEGAGFTTCTGPFSQTGLADGSYQFAVRSVDAAGNISTAENYSWIIHSTGPVMAWDVVPTTRNNFTSTSAEFNATTIAGLTVTGFQCSLDGATYTTCASPRTITSLAQGSHTLSVRAIDSLGVTGTAISTTWFTDLTGPTLSISSGPTGYQAATSASFAFLATDAEGSGIAGYECALDGASYAPCTSPVSYTSLSEASHTVLIRASDSTGNIGSATSRSWITDYTIPILNITSGPTNPTDTTSTAAIAFTASDTSGITLSECSLDGGAFANCSSPANYSGISTGSHTVTVRVTDGVGRTNTGSHTWVRYTYSWSSGGYSACSAAQPSWNAGSFGGCSVGQPAFTYGGWGGCSASCGGGAQYRDQYCSQVWGTQYRSVSCPTNSGSQTRSVVCTRNDGVTVADAKCSSAGAKPATSQACSRNDCAGGAPASSQGCYRGGGGDCHSGQTTSQSCNTHSCYSWQSGGGGGYQCPGNSPPSGSCTNGGEVCYVKFGITSRSYYTCR